MNLLVRQGNRVRHVLPMVFVTLALFAARAELERAADSARLARVAQQEQMSALDAFLIRLEQAVNAPPPA